MKIEKTYDYSMFKHIEGNRVLNQLHVNALVKSMKGTEMIRPIDVNENMEIIDGQHRFQALMELKRPIYYIVHEGWDFNNVISLNTHQKNWSIDDFVSAYAEMGIYDYIRLKNLIDKYKINTSLAMVAVSKVATSKRDYSKLRAGMYKVTDEQCDRAEEMIKYWLEFKNHAHFYSKRVFFEAVMTVYLMEEVDNDDMLRNFKKYTHLVRNMASRREFVRMLETIYNYHKPNKIRFF